mgnify:CR=1 FL=1
MGEMDGLRLGLGFGAGKACVQACRCIVLAETLLRRERDAQFSHTTVLRTATVESGGGRGLGD